jgi:D-alanyl-D-alanine carboxypeptidase (penicillin-binding protein 5/6)
MLIASANDAAATLAVGIAGSSAAFVAAMNQRASQLGLAATHYSNPIGLDAPRNFSSAADLVRLTELLRRNAFFRRTVALPSARLAGGERTRTIDNTDNLVGAYPFVTGVKTGHTPGAGYVLVGSATRGGVTVLSAVIGDPTPAARDADTLALLRYGLARYRRVVLVRAGLALASARVRYRESDRIALVGARSAFAVVRRGELPAFAVRAPRTLTGPLRAGAAVGTVTVRLRGRVVAAVPLLTAAPVPAVPWSERALDFAVKPGTLGGLALLVAGGAGLTALRRRRSRTAAELPS